MLPAWMLELLQAGSRLEGRLQLPLAPAVVLEGFEQLQSPAYGFDAKELEMACQSTAAVSRPATAVSRARA